MPRSHPVVERLIGTVPRECLDRLVFWSAADLERKLLEFQRYYNEHRAHAGRAGRPPAASLDTADARASLRAYRWQPALSWAVSHAERRVTPSNRSAFTAAVYEFATHRLD